MRMYMVEVEEVGAGTTGTFVSQNVNVVIGNNNTGPTITRECLWR